MAKKNKNPYREGSAYATIFEFIRSKQVVTRKDLIAEGFSIADITVVLSPRDEGASTRGGDPRGNLSAQGHLYFLDKLAKKKGEDQRFRLRWRKTPLDKLVRPPKKDVASRKASKKVEAVATVEDAEAVEAVETVETVETVAD